MDAEGLWNCVFGRVTLSRLVVARLLGTVLCWNPTEKISYINRKRSTSLKNHYKDKLKCNKNRLHFWESHFIMFCCPVVRISWLYCAQIFIIPHFSVVLTGDPPITLSVCYFSLLAFVHQRMLDKWTPILCKAWLPLICCMCSTIKHAFWVHTASKVYHLCRVSLLLTGRVCKWNQN